MIRIVLLGCQLILIFSTAYASEQPLSWLDDGWNKLRQGQTEAALQAWQQGIDQQPSDRLFPVLGAFPRLNNAQVYVKRIGRDQQGLIIRKSTPTGALYYVISARDTPRNRKLRNRSMQDLIQRSGITTPLLANEAWHFQTLPLTANRQSVVASHSTVSTSIAPASKGILSWLDDGWNKLRHDQTEAALQAWQQGIDQQPSDRLFPVLGAFPRLNNAQMHVKRIGRDQQGLIIRKSTPTGALYYVISARDTPRNRKLRNRSMQDLIQRSGITTPLLANEAWHFQTLPLTANRQSSATHTLLFKRHAKDHKKAVKLARNKQYEKALDLLAPYMKKPQQFPRIDTDYMVILNWAKHHAEAIRYFEQRPADMPVPDYLRSAIADSYFQTGQLHKSCDLFSKVASTSPQYTKAIRGRLNCLIALHKFDDAMTLAWINPQVSPVDSAFLAIATGHYKQGFERYIGTLDNNDKKHPLQAMQKRLTYLPMEDRKRISSELKIRARTHGNTYTIYHLLWLALLEQKSATAYKLNHHAPFGKHSTNQLSQIGWILYRSGRFQQAEQVFLAARSQNTSHFRVNLGLLYSHIRMKHMSQAEQILKELQQTHGNDVDLLYASAFFHEKQHSFWAAVSDYEKILASHPNDKVARKLQIGALSALGASTKAWNEAKRYLPANSKLQDSLRDSQAVTRLHWDEAMHALKILDPLLKKQHVHAQFDHVSVLVGANEANKAVKAYEQILADGIPPPLWLQQSAAGAYLTIEQREKALEIYNHVLVSWPKSFGARIGKFYSLYELQRWDEADAVLKSLEVEKRPWQFSRFPHERLNPQRVSIALVRSLWLIGQQRYPEAEKFLNKLNASAPGNIDFREALASLHMLRGWKHKALREFRIIDSLKSREPSHPPRLKLSESLNSMEKKEKARLLLHSEQLRHPLSPNVGRLQRAYDVEGMRALEFGARYENSQDGALDLLTYARFTQPLTLYDDIFFELLHRRSSQGPLLQKFNRIGMGFDHRFNSQWHIRETLSGDYVISGDVGSLSELFWNPDDYWRTHIYYDSFIVDMPVRARVFGVTANRVGGDLVYRWSDWHEGGLTLSRSDYSDRNQRLAANLHYERNILADGDWRLRVFGSLYTSSGSLNNTPYFNPSRDASLTGKLMIEHNTWHRYESMKKKYGRRFIQRLYFTGGDYWQRGGFGSGAIVSIRYEQDIAFSDTHHFRWGVNWGRRPYDGQSVGTYSIDGYYRWDF